MYSIEHPGLNSTHPGRQPEIGDEAFHTLENDLDWLEISDPLRAAKADETR